MNEYLYFVLLCFMYKILYKNKSDLIILFGFHKNYSHFITKAIITKNCIIFRGFINFVSVLI